MDIKDLNKKQLLLLCLLITFVVSIATGIITVSLMQQMPKSVPQTINNVIQRTIEKVVEAPAQIPQTTQESNFTAENALVDIYALPLVETTQTQTPDSRKQLGKGVIVSDIGLVLVDSSILTGADTYSVHIGTRMLYGSLVQTIGQSISILKLSDKKQIKTEATPPVSTQIPPQTLRATLDKKLQ
jgi:hypothetical protein